MKDKTQLENCHTSLEKKPGCLKRRRCLPGQKSECDLVLGYRNHPRATRTFLTKITAPKLGRKNNEGMSFAVYLWKDDQIFGLKIWGGRNKWEWV